MLAFRISGTHKSQLHDFPAAEGLTVKIVHKDTTCRRTDPFKDILWFVYMICAIRPFCEGLPYWNQHLHIIIYLNEDIE